MDVPGGIWNDGTGTIYFQDLGGNIGTLNVANGVNNNSKGTIQF